MGEIDVSHTVRLYTLLLLKKQPMHGYGLLSRIEDMTGTRPSAAHIYPFLKRLQEHGYVDEEEDGRKTVYHLTEEGKTFVDERISSFGNLLDDILEHGIQECAHCDCVIYGDGYEHNGKVYCCQHCASDDS